MEKANGSKGTLSVVTNMTAIVLAGGKSTRMGRDKAELPFAGTTLLRRQVETARRALGGSGEVRVSGPGRGLPSWPDDDPGGGPLSGVAAALARIPFGRRLMVIPVDMPLLSPSMLERLGAAASGDEIVTRFRGHPMPFVVFNGPVVLALAARFAGERRSVREFCAILSCREIDADPGEERGFFNTNTTEEWRSLNDLAIVE